MKYLCLLRGINVGGKNKLSMAELKTHLSESGFKNVSSYINSGNILLESDMQPRNVARAVEDTITKGFKLDSELIKVCVLTVNELEVIVNQAPKGFGTEPDKYHSDVLFPMEIASSEIMAVNELHPEVDAAWEANGVVYYRRLSARRTSSRLNRVISKPIYKSITIRSWNTTTKLLGLLK